MGFGRDTEVSFLYGPELRKESIYSSHENSQVSRICHESPSKVSDINESTCFSSTLSLCRKFAAKTICRTLPRWEGVASSSSEIWLQEVLQKLEELWMRKGVLFSKWMESCCRGVTSRILQKKLPFWTNQFHKLFLVLTYTVRLTLSLSHVTLLVTG